MGKASKEELQPKLENAGIACSAGSTKPCRSIGEKIIGELRVVECVEKFSTELEIGSFFREKWNPSEILEEGDIPLVTSCAVHHISSRVPKACCAGSRTD